VFCGRTYICTQTVSAWTRGTRGCSLAHPAHPAFLPMLLRGGGKGRQERGGGGKASAGQGSRLVGRGVDMSVWIEHESWEEEWRKTMGHDLTRLRKQGVETLTQPHKRPSPVPEEDETVVPGLFHGPLDAVHKAADGSRLFIKAGRYCWDEGRGDVASVVSELYVRGKEDTVLWGRWSLEPTSHGIMRDVTVALDLRAPACAASLSSSLLSSCVCVSISGGPWEFREMELRAAGASAVCLSYSAAHVCVCV
jgi:hypothetical protein